MRTYLIIFCCLASAALAHTGVKDPDVKARMDLMTQSGPELKVLSDMARGLVLFDANAAENARGALQDQAVAMPTAFLKPADDPKSEARRLIWDDWDGFLAKAKAMEAAATTPIATLDDLRASLGSIGKTCSACHEVYRLEGD